ncbi:iron-sulfur cluster assembly protein [Paraburkholderia tropica]|jgi:iron-sulfur cluster assembly protein|uniref:Iron-binding protein IscA n=1 Tax=Paraburkholderia tropica TaxID=92647 RepID=A0AAQ1JYF8_9BURK|nr:iron-sulfur cluster assembly protein IscA [Paraburkholderia tropica]MBB2984017.1 iron-sulfur cluster assembly protein [Paraburkholderia tropica]MBB3004755.1 iron-sulfur cluster assembly protein [Paraburkholderia tropica]MBB6323839.1 iron-sulfur cluster assembly protein [Paraburkholderia tropica]PXX07896.1 iron-sulfur cluster assembly protein [Paraburkholderia tropica]PZW73316.1 iron-sulfur cluster assembly protein [Paraburkholderia tropica]
MTVSLTPAAARHVARSLQKRGSGVGLRVAVKTSGCSGFAYALEFVDTPNVEDRCFEAYGVTIVVDPRSLPMLDGTELDFVREGLNEGFKFHNPNAKANCGCGESFAV